MASSTSNPLNDSSSSIYLTENDIPGASLLGRKPEELKNTELRLWLKCRGDLGKGLKTKAELVKRVHEYIRTGKDKNIIDPDPDKIYSRRKERVSTSTDVGDQDSVSVQFPSVGWGTSLDKMPMFTRVEMNRHIMKSGKSIANKDHHTVPTGLVKAQRFLDDEYLEEIQCTSDQRYFFFQSKCCHSFRKNDPSHHLRVALCIVSGEVKSACCSCVAGKVGFCNHVLALMFKLCKFSLFNCTSTKDLCKEEDQNSPLACTSQLQQWHEKGGGSNVVPQIETETRQQAECEKWKEERKFRFTASQFQLISKRQRNHEGFAETLMNPKPVSSKYLEHGKKYEPVALMEYEKFMFSRRTPVKVLPSGLVVSKGSPILGGTPDARVIDFGCVDHFGLAEVKCPYTKYHVTPLDACSDAKFCMEKTSDTECKLKENHPYYAQVQGQMAVTGARWCDFVVYTSKGLYVQRIPFNPEFWEDLKQKLVSYYFNHFIKFAAANQLYQGNCQLNSNENCLVLSTGTFK